MKPITVASLAAIYVIWGSTFFAMKAAMASFPPLMMGGIRFLVAGGGLYLFLRLRRAPAPSAVQWRNAGIVGGLMMTVGNGSLALAQVSVPSSLCALIYASIPIWATLVSGLLGEWPSRRVWVGLAVGLAGMALFQSNGISGGGVGTLLALFGAVASGAGVALMRRLQLPHGAMGTASQILVAGVMLLGFSAVRGETLLATPTAASWVAVAYLVVFGSLVAYAALVHLSRAVTPTLATSYAYVNPVVAAGLGLSLGGESLPASAGLGLVLVFAALALVSSRGGAKATPNAQQDESEGSEPHPVAPEALAPSNPAAPFVRRAHGRGSKRTGAFAEDCARAVPTFQKG